MSILYAALASPCGLVVYSDDPMKLRQRLYATRRDLAEPDLLGLSFLESPTNPDEHLWIVKQRSDADGTEV
jgi:hypothetical protein